ncbi:growth/differentiation factor 10b [Centroberyx gerrardi]|uniref:growth/differentiation factor 10b n=1 Tax=Centroberyx gerrardi TaxID=166262 RepID=UPI003AAE2664
MEATKTSRIAFVLAVVGTLTLRVAAHVFPPANVTLHCHNFRNVLHWNYSQLDLMPRFRIDIGSMRRRYEPLWENSPNLRSDISFLSDPSDDYYLTVTAVIGGNESDAAPAEGIKFSYYEDSPSNQKCSVDLPPVNVTVKPDGIIEFSFLHPSLYHQKLSPKQKSRQKKHQHAQIKELPEFTYYVADTYQQEHQRHQFSCVDSVCEEELPVDGGQEKHCLRIHGQWERVAVRPTQEYCALAQAPDVKTKHAALAVDDSLNSNRDYTALYIGLPLLLGAALCFVAFMVYRKQTQGSASLPASMTFTGRLKQKIMRDASLIPDSLTVHPPSPTDTHLLSSGESPDAETPEEEGRLRIGVSIQDKSVSGRVEERVEEGEGPGYTQGGGLDGDVEEREREILTEDCGSSSGYEQRSRLVTVVEMAPGDEAEGYRG